MKIPQLLQLGGRQSMSAMRTEGEKRSGNLPRRAHPPTFWKQLVFATSFSPFVIVTLIIYFLARWNGFDVSFRITLNASLGQPFHTFTPESLPNALQLSPDQLKVEIQNEGLGLVDQREAGTVLSFCWFCPVHYVTAWWQWIVLAAVGMIPLLSIKAAGWTDKCHIFITISTV